MMRALKYEDIPVCVEKHLKYMEASIHTLSGSGWLAQLYLGLLNADDAFCVVNEDSKGNILGAVAGVVNVNVFSKRMVKRVFANMRFFHLLKICLRYPGMMFYDRGLDRYSKRLLNFGAHAYLAFIWVDAEHRSNGEGRKLMSAFEDKLVEVKQPKYYLYCTEGNPANEFYHSWGCKTVGKYKETNIYVSCD